MAEMPGQNQDEALADMLSGDNATIKSLLEIIARQNREIEQLRAGQNYTIKDDISSIKEMISSIAGKLEKFIQIFSKFVETKVKKE